MRLLLIRHAESEGNAAGIIQGRAEFPLSPRGERQAELLAARLAQGTALAALISSPLQRAAATAGVIAARTALSVLPLPALMEYDFGEGNGSDVQTALERFGARTAGGFRRFPGEEGREAFRKRVCAALFALEAEHSDEVVAVVSHAGPIAAFCVTVLGLPYAGRAPFAIDNASISIVDVREGSGTVLGINDTCHLDALDGA